MKSEVRSLRTIRGRSWILTWDSRVRTAETARSGFANGSSTPEVVLGTNVPNRSTILGIGRCLYAFSVGWGVPGIACEGTIEIGITRTCRMGGDSIRAR